MLINRVAFCFSSNLNAVPSGPWRCLVFKLWSTDEWEQRKWMNAWWMEMGRAFVAVGKRSDRRWKEEESERMWERRGRRGRTEGDARYSASEGVLACSFFTASLIISHRHTHRRIHTRCNAKKQSRHAYEDAFNASSFFPPILSVTAIVQGRNERPSALVWLSPGVPWLSVEPVIINSCRFYWYRMLINPNVLFGVERPVDPFNIS